MILHEILKNQKYQLVRGDIEKEIEWITENSRDINNNTLFICIKGTVFDGHQYIVSILGEQIVALMIQEEYTEDVLEWASEYKDITIIAVKDTRIGAAECAAAFYEYPAKKLKLIGITGTKGKTTTSYLIEEILRCAGYKVGLLGTIEYKVGDVTVKAERTTPNSVMIQRYLNDMVNSGCQFAVMEVSSQGIKQNRIHGLYFDCAIFTNIGDDHISMLEHKNMEEYIECKSKLFKQSRIGIGNVDDLYYSQVFKNATCECLTYSCKKTADAKATDITFLSRNKELGVLFYCDHETYAVSIPGIFNVYNALAAILTAKLYNVPLDMIKKSLAHIHVPGRAEIVAVNQEYMILIDYAHNALSLKNILITMRKYHPRQLKLLFGCGGGRSKGRRRMMGEIAGKYADYTIITSDNPRYENPIEIIQMIEEGIKSVNGRYEVIINREEAIARLIQCARPGDLLILAGKGHEMEQETEGRKIAFNERVIVEKYAKLNNYTGV